MTLCPTLRHLSAEHARWLADLARLAGEDQEEGRCGKIVALWEREILPHCRAEEDVLLPELAGKVSESDATIVFTLSDHLVLRQLARVALGGDPAARAAALASLARKLAEHFAFEERTLFPALQAALGCDRLAALGAEIARTGPTREPPRPPRASATHAEGTRGTRR